MSITSSLAPSKILYFTLDKILEDYVDANDEILDDLETTYQSYKNELNSEFRTDDTLWLELQAGQCEQFGKTAKSILYRIIKSSVNHPENSIAAANAITILKTMRVSLSCLDLRDVHIPGADLSNAILDGANLSGANLENVNLSNASLNYTNMQKSILKEIKLGFDKIFNHRNPVNFIRAENSLLITQDVMSTISIWDIKTGDLKEEFSNGKKEIDLHNLHFFYNDKFFITNSNNAIAIWSINPLIKQYTLPIPSSKSKVAIIPIFAFSPQEDLLVVCYQCVHIPTSKTKNIVQFFNIANLLSTELTLTNLKKRLQNTEGVAFQTDCLIKAKEFKKETEVDGIQKISFSPKGTWIVTLHEEGHQNILKLRDPTDFHVITSIAMTTFNVKVINYLTLTGSRYLFSSDEKLLFTVDKNTVYMWHLWDDRHKQWVINPQKNKLFTEPDACILGLIHFDIDTCMLSYTDNVVSRKSEINNLIGTVNMCVEIDISSAKMRYENDVIKTYFRNLRNDKVLYFTPRAAPVRSSNFAINKDIICEKLNNTSFIMRKIQDVYIEQKQRDINTTILDILFSPDSSVVRILSQNYKQKNFDIYTYNFMQNFGHRRAYFLEQHPSIKRFKGEKYKNYQELSFSQNPLYIVSKTINNKLAARIYNIELLNIDNPFSEIYSFDCDVEAITVSSNKEFIALIENNIENHVQVWSTHSKKLLGSYTIQDLTTSISSASIVISQTFSLKKGYIAFVINERVTLLKLESNNSNISFTTQFQKKLFPNDSGQLIIEKPKIQFIKNDQYLVITCKERIVIWDIYNSMERELNIIFLNKPEHIVVVDFSLDAIYFVACIERSEKVMLSLFEFNTGNLLYEREVTEPVSNIKFSPCGKFFTTWSERGSINIWQLLNGTLRLLWRSYIYTATREIDVQDAIELSEDNKKKLLK